MFVELHSSVYGFWGLRATSFLFKVSVGNYESSWQVLMKNCIMQILSCHGADIKETIILLILEIFVHMSIGVYCSWAIISLLLLLSCMCLQARTVRWPYRQQNLSGSSPASSPSAHHSPEPPIWLWCKKRSCGWWGDTLSTTAHSRWFLSK